MYINFHPCEGRASRSLFSFLEREARVFEKVMKYILNYTLGESFEYIEENLATVKAFGHNYEIVEITPNSAELLNKTELK